MAIKPGRVAIVTGAGQGLGEGISKRLAAEGAYVVAVDINANTLSKVVDKINEAGSLAIGVTGDVGLKQDADRIAKTAIDKWGKVDILVNNAGITRDAILYKMTEEQWDEVLRVNLKGPFLMIQACYWSMRNKRYGRIINISSSACRGNIGQANYSSAKAGLIDTPMARSVPKEIFESWTKAQPTGRLGTPDDIAEMVLFFAGENSGYITGQHIWVDGAMQTGLKC